MKEKDLEPKECDGYGYIPADFMFVGISAGRLGALVTKVPFTKDASGRIFQRCLNRLGLSRSDEFSLQPELINCYVTNLVKSRVLTKKGLNRLPTTREMLDWFPCLKEEVGKVKPRKVLALGELVFNFIYRNWNDALVISDSLESDVLLPYKHSHAPKLLYLHHPRWFQSHGALNAESKAFAQMVMEYWMEVFGK